MGVDCKVTLPSNVQVQDVAHILGIAAGIKPKWDGTQNGDCKWVKVPGTKVESSIPSLPSMVLISLSSSSEGFIDGEMNHQAFYYFEYNGKRLLNVRSTAFWIGCATRVVDFFGGEIDYNDCDEKECDYKVKAKSNKLNCPQDGKEWDNFQQRVFNVKPLTKNELEEFDEIAAYKRES